MSIGRILAITFGLIFAGGIYNQHFTDREPINWSRPCATRANPNKLCDLGPSQAEYERQQLDKAEREQYMQDQRDQARYPY